jgi:hypothetical protein
VKKAIFGLNPMVDLCDKTIRLGRGRTEERGPSEDVVAGYRGSV